MAPLLSHGVRLLLQRAWSIWGDWHFACTLYRASQAQVGGPAQRHVVMSVLIMDELHFHDGVC